MSPLRRNLVLILTVLLIVITFSTVIYSKSAPTQPLKTKVSTSESETANNPGKSNQDKLAQLTVTYEERIFEIQAKFTYGLMTFLENQRGSGISREQFFDLKKTIDESFEQALKAPQAQLKAKSFLFLTKELILFDALDLTSARNSACRKLLSSEQIEVSSEELQFAVNHICLSQKSPDLSPESRGQLKSQLAWFYDLYAAPRNSDSKLKLVSKETQAAAHSTMIKVAYGLTIAFFLGTLSFFLSIYFFFKLILGKARFAFEKAIIPSDYCLEIFFLYMLSMNLLPIALQHPSLRAHLLPINAIAISSLSLIALWPVVFSQDLSETLRTIGLRLGGISKFSKDIFVGILSYIAAIVPMLLVLTIYSLVLVFFKIDVSSGTHPIVPILTESKNSSTIVWILLLAVVVAPFVEEIMFRGALYTWLRDRSGATVSILLSSFIFAVIHPQGLVGIVPLTCIGIVLALIREWRGNLTSCMIAHACFNGGTLLIALNLLR